MVLKGKFVNKNVLFYVAVVFYLIEGMLSKSFFVMIIPEIIMKFFILSSMCFLMAYKAIDILSAKYRISHIISLAISFLFLPFFYIRLGLKVCLFFVFVLFGRNIDFKQVSKVIIVTLSVLLFLIVFSAKIGIIQNYTIIERGRSRQYLGFLYALYPLSVMCNITFLYIYVYKEKITFKALLILLVSNFYIYNATRSRLSFICSLIMIIIGFRIRYNSNCGKVLSSMRKLRIFLCFCFVIAATISFMFIYIYDANNLFMAKVNEILEERIELSKMSVKIYGVNLFGQSIEWIGNGLNSEGKVNVGTYLYVDNFYLNYLQRLGIVPFVFLMTLITRTLLKANKNGDLLLIIICCIESIHGIIDDGVFSMRYFSFWLICANYLYSDRLKYDYRIISLAETLYRNLHLKKTTVNTIVKALKQKNS